MADLDINFFYLGGDKCGSTWLHNLLSAHPDVELARAKELFYFDRFYEKGWAWYQAQFAGVPAKRRGEICHDYLYSDEALERIARDAASDAVFIITLRNPVERTLSHWRYLRKIGRTRLGFEDALAAHAGLIQHSLYSARIERAFTILGRERVKVLWFDDLKSDARGFGQELCLALDIAPSADLPVDAKVMEGGHARAPWLVHLLRNAGWAVRAMGAPALVGKVKSHPTVNKVLFSSQTSRTETRSLEPAARALLATQFLPDIDRLQGLTGRDLGAWRATLEA